MERLEAEQKKKNEAQKVRAVFVSSIRSSLTPYCALEGRIRACWAKARRADQAVEMAAGVSYGPGNRHVRYIGGFPGAAPFPPLGHLRFPTKNGRDLLHSIQSV